METKAGQVIDREELLRAMLERWKHDHRIEFYSGRILIYTLLNELGYDAENVYKVCNCEDDLNREAARIDILSLQEMFDVLTSRKELKTKYAISRSINGISLNGQEFLLTPEGDVMTFDNETLAKSFAGKITTGRHDPDVDLEEFGLNICRIDEQGNYELV